VNPGRIVTAVEWWKHMKALRLRLGVKGTELSERSGLSPQRISDLEAGRYPSPELDTLLSVCRGLGVSLDELIPQDSRLTEPANDLGWQPTDVQTSDEVPRYENGVDIGQQRRAQLERIRRLGLELVVLVDQAEDFELQVANRKTGTDDNHSDE
jgi:transcriptional regulator with XRE-family HTH domain